ncbi:MAG TPA: nuclear transport factor 2 family protein [Acidimicrobiales bacterium]|nr:nuclear transport factor 2 family protein [Acidimicrobiales bacterium]
MPTPDQLRHRITEYVHAVNSRDANAIAAQFTEDAHHHDPVSNPPNVGRAAIVAFFESGIGASDTWTFTAKAIHTCADNVAIDFEIAVETGGATMVIDGIEVFEAGEDGLFTSVRAYWDDASLSFR